MTKYDMPSVKAHMPPEMYESLRTRAFKSHKSMSAVIRDAVAVHLEQLRRAEEPF